MTIDNTQNYDIFEKMGALHDGQVHFFNHSQSGLKAIIAIDSLARGPALGGCRFIEYKSTNDAIYDVIRLAKCMTLKAAITNLDFGGGKTVILRPKNLKNREELFYQLGNFVESLNGQYITAMDSGTTIEDMLSISNYTDYVIRLRPNQEFPTSDPSSYTALGIFYGMQAAAKHKLNVDSLDGLHIAISGMGKVGQHLAKLLLKAGATLTIADIDVNTINTFLNNHSVKTCSHEEIYSISCDIFSPCALGGCLNKHTINKLKTDIIAGSANNQLAHRSYASDLHKRDILYAPDFVINAGGLIQATSLYLNQTEQIALDKIKTIHNIMQTIFMRAQQQDKSPNQVAIELAIEQLPIDQSLANKIYLQPNYNFSDIVIV